MNIRTAAAHAAELLASAGIEDARDEARLIMRELLDADMTFLVTHGDDEISDDARGKLDTILARRAKREPLQYIIKYGWFYGRKFTVGDGVLIPRPETELLIEAALEERFDYFLDWGTGSGCIASTLLCERKNARAVAAEKNPLSIRMAWGNMKRLGVLPRCLLWHSRVLDDLPVARGSLDLIISNPPYIRSGALEALMPEVRCEPALALDGGADGMMCYNWLLTAAPVLLRKGGRLIMEVGDDEQGNEFASRRYEGLELGYVRPDYNGISRAALWIRN